MTKLFDLEERTFQFAKNAYLLCKKIRTNTLQMSNINQLVRASSSVGANYREANDALGKKILHFVLRFPEKKIKNQHFFLG